MTVLSRADRARLLSDRGISTDLADMIDPDPGKAAKQINVLLSHTDMRNATKAERDAELRKLGVRRFFQ